MIEVTLIGMPQFTTPTFKIKVDGQEIGHIREDVGGTKWVLMPAAGTSKAERTVTVNQWRSKEAAACALAARYFEGQKEVTDGGDSSEVS